MLTRLKVEELLDLVWDEYDKLEDFDQIWDQIPRQILGPIWDQIKVGTSFDAN